MDIQSRRGQTTILPRQPDTQAQTLQAGQRLDQFSGRNQSFSGGNNIQQLLLQLILQLLNQLKDGGAKPEPKPNPTTPEPGIVQPVYGAVIGPIDDPIIQPVYGVVIDPIDDPIIQPVYGVVIDPIDDPWKGGGAQPVYGAIIDNSSIDYPNKNDN